MKIFLLLTGSISIVLGLMSLQLRSMKTYHPNAELLAGVLKLLKPYSPRK